MCGWMDGAMTGRLIDTDGVSRGGDLRGGWE